MPILRLRYMSCADSMTAQLEVTGTPRVTSIKEA